MIDRLNAESLPKRGQRLTYQAERACWRLIDLSKCKPVTIAEIEKLARETEAIEPWETVAPES